jgi:hypothetical protein
LWIRPRLLRGVDGTAQLGHDAHDYSPSQ